MVKSALFSLLAMLFFAGCSVKHDANIEMIKEDKSKILKDGIEISQDFSDGFKVYFNDDNEITYLCSAKSLDACSYSMDVDEEDFFWVSSLGYKPSISMDTRGVQCGTGSYYGYLAIFMVPPVAIENYTEKNAKVCKHRFVELDRTQMFERIVMGLFTFGTPLITGGNMHTKKFDKESFRDALFASNIETFKKQLLEIDAKHEKLDGFDVVYLEKDGVEDALKEKYELLLEETSKKSGVVFLEKDSNKLLWINVFDEHKSQNLIDSISLQIQDLFQSVQNSDAYLLKHKDVVKYVPAKIPLPKVPSVPILVKDEFENRTDFNARVQKAVQQRESNIRNLQRRYSLEVSNRNDYIKKLQDSYSDYLEQYSRDKRLFLDSLEKNIALLSKVLFLQNVSGYSAKEFNYDAQTQKMYFKIYAQKHDFTQSVVATIPAKIAKRIKLNETFKVVPNIEAKQNKIKLLGFNIVELDSKKSFEAKYTNTFFKPKEVSVRVAHLKEGFEKEDSKYFQHYIQKPLAVVDSTKKEIWYIDMAKSINAKVPKWFSSPTNTLKVIGYGEAESLLEAKANARNDLAYMLRVQINTSFFGMQKASSLSNFSQTKEKTLQSSKLELDSSDYKVYKQDLVDGRWYVGLEYLK